MPVFHAAVQRGHRPAFQAEPPVFAVAMLQVVANRIHLVRLEVRLATKPVDDFIPKAFLPDRLERTQEPTADSPRQGFVATVGQDLCSSCRLNHRLRTIGIDHDVAHAAGQWRRQNSGSHQP